MWDWSMWDWSIRPGDIFTVIGAVMVAFSVLYRRGALEARLTLAIEVNLQEITEIKHEMKLFSATMTKIAVQETQIGFLMKWYDELRRGKGWITPDE